MKIKDIGNIVTGYSNKITTGNNNASFLNISYRKTNEYLNKNTSIKMGTLKKLTITKNMIILSPYKNSSFVDLGANHQNKVLGKNLIAIQVDEKKYNVYYLYLLFKNNILHIPYEGTAIKIIKNKDILEINIPEVKEDILDIAKRLDQYEYLLEKQKELTKSYLKGIIQKGAK